MKPLSLPRPVADALSALRPPRDAACSWTARGVAGALAAVGVSAGLAAALAPWWGPSVAAAVAAAMAALSLARVGPLRFGARTPSPPAAATQPPASPPAQAPELVDPATGLATQAHFLEMFDREWARARRYGVGAALAIIELDRPADPGAPAGDAALAALAREVRASLRAADFAGHHGLSSLLVFLAHADAIGAVDALERIRDHLEQLQLRVGGSSTPLTVSAGVAMLRPSHLDAYVLMADAEAALRAAQAAGGNCVRAAPGPISPGARAARSR